MPDILVVQFRDLVGKVVAVSNFKLQVFIIMKKLSQNNKKSPRFPRRVDGEGCYSRPRAKTWGGTFSRKKDRRISATEMHSLKQDNSSLK